ncbi:MAG: hypothetical protein K1X36_11440 [Pyrinomonadaceae bacterium]|nr:hypothetical protein [Pyrinomonadaceae bacterium]
MRAFYFNSEAVCLPCISDYRRVLGRESGSNTGGVRNAILAFRQRADDA